MKTKEAKALEIAKAEGLIGDGLEDPDKLCYLIDLYTSYQGLMPIVERINMSFYDGNHTKIFIYSDAIDVIQYISFIVRFDISEKHNEFNIEDSLLDALLDAIHYVLCGGEDEKD